MVMFFELMAASLLAYLFGSISSAIIVCKLMGLKDPRSEGSKNPGATNVLRIGGRRAALITLLGDALKGFIPVFIAKLLALNPITIALLTFSAFFGHLFPIFFRFEGGKGVATTLGCLFALSWQAALAWVLTWFVVALIFRYASLASLIASLFIPLYIWHFTQNWIYLFTITGMSLLLISRHRTNIIHLFAGNEKKLGEKSRSSVVSNFYKDCKLSKGQRGFMATDKSSRSPISNR